MSKNKKVTELRLTRQSSDEPKNVKELTILKTKVFFRVNKTKQNKTNSTTHFIQTSSKILSEFWDVWVHYLSLLEKWSIRKFDSMFWNSALNNLFWVRISVLTIFKRFRSCDINRIPLVNSGWFFQFFYVLLGSMSCVVLNDFYFIKHGPSAKVLRVN